VPHFFQVIAGVSEYAVRFLSRRVQSVATADQRQRAAKDTDVY
jgi:hypothetical protein